MLEEYKEDVERADGYHKRRLEGVREGCGEGKQSKVPQLPTLSVLRKFSLCVFTAGVNSATHLKTSFPVIFSQTRCRRRARKDPKPWDTKFRSERRFVELETRSPENAPVAGVPRLKTTTSAPRHRHVSDTSSPRQWHVIATCH
ncbi:hypothetical protein PIB30_063695 [Stylosanthes scabra]|uniref:Uncharacterized protein n=1 Tax=Stylosanthes scabra TaxID=79078 RepID=A0ABU6XLW1_9FABA|nr:hypothetical protein [Stylosanthes scabra]